jgi:nucleotide-binding universal stress UspA family protein
MPIKDILHPTDFSSVSNGALRFAAAIARKQKSKIHIVHAYQRPYSTIARSGGFTAELDTRLNEQIKEQINDEIDRLARTPDVKGLAMSKTLAVDIDPWEIVQRVGKIKADLIVMGTRGNTKWLPNALVGTNASRVIRYSPVPVLVVPDGVTFAGIKRIMLATDFSEPMNVFYPLVVEFAKMFGAELHVAVVNTRRNFMSNNEAQLRYTAYSKKFPYGKTHFWIHNSEDVEEGIADMVRSKKIDLLAMLTHGYTGIQRILEGSVAENISKDLKVPMLTYQHNPPKITKKK